MDEDGTDFSFMASVGPPNYKQIKKYVLWWLPSSFVSLVLVGIADTVTRYRYGEIIGPIPTVVFALPPLVFGGYLAARTLRRFTVGIAHDGLTVNGRIVAFGDASLGRWQVLQRYGDMTAGTALHLRSRNRHFVLGGRDHRLANDVRLEADPVDRVDAWMWDSDFAELVTKIPGLDVGGPAPGEPLRCLLFRRPTSGKVAPTPSRTIDVGADTITIINPDTDAPVAAVSPTEVAATPAEWTRPERNAATWPVLVARIPGSQALSMTCLDGPRFSFRPRSAYRFSWHDEAPEKQDPAYLVSAADWLTLVEELGLAPLLQDSARTGTRSRKPARSRARIVSVLGSICVLAGLGLALAGVDHMREYQDGTPTTATIDRCDHETCYARWTVGGVSQTSEIIGQLPSGHDLVGSQVEVHVTSGDSKSGPYYDAYTASEASPNSALLFAGLFAFATGVVSWWSARRKIKTGRWPWSRRRS
jgi:hypothetical protein